ncbi:hypothetical protein BS50DRAFT_656280 [Corynespora cassiicola Philippines]|uniref:Uncharacterized protein n=1 Tax=Corynespora cassiicola Philippines TaxID=1448308 RepID=A0A2T2N3S5_CORCC|nr:hypothetical protein BS50DRAFT_656280 [Corynespora cassiicola Philippines]
MPDKTSLKLVITFSLGCLPRLPLRRRPLLELLTTLLSEEEALLIDNHSSIDPVEAEYPRDHSDYQLERRRAREAAFQRTVENPAFRTRTIILTDFQSNNDLGRAVAAEYAEAAQRAGRLFLPIYLDCDIDENARRVASSQRKISGTTKLWSAEVLADMRAIEGMGGITLDVTHMSPEEAAGRLDRENGRLRV